MKPKPNRTHLSLISIYFCLSTGVLFSCSSGNSPDYGSGPTVTASPSTPEVVPADGVRESMDSVEESTDITPDKETTLPEAGRAKSTVSAKAERTNEDVPTRAEKAKEDVSVEGFPLSDKDREITRSLRETLIENENLSIMAKNLQIFSQKGEVILRGTVESQKEKQVITSLAKKTRGVVKVKDEMEVSRE